MPLSLDLRKRVVEFIERGGRVTEAARRYQVGRATIYRWLKRENLEATQVKRRKRKLDLQALEKDTEVHPDITLKARAEKFGVTPAAVCHAYKKLRITRKKKSFVTKREIERKE